MRIVNLQRGAAIRAASVPLLALFLILACDDSALAPEAPPAAVLVSAAYDIWTGVLIEGESIRMEATPLAGDGSELPPAQAMWSVTDPDVATIDESGLLVGVSPGPVQVIATIRGVSGSMYVEVTEPGTEVDVVLVSPAAAVLSVGEARAYSARAYDAGGQELPGLPVAWSVHPATRASVDADGLVRPLAPGYVDVTASIRGRSASVGLTVVPAERPAGGGRE